MGDRTYHALAVDGRVDDTTLAEAVAAFAGDYDHDTDPERCERDGWPEGIGFAEICERSVGDSEDAAHAVAEVMHRVGERAAAFTVTEDPRYELSGQIWRWTPERGMFHADCDATSSAVLTDGQARRILAEASDPAAALAAIREALGLDWRTPPTC